MKKIKLFILVSIMILTFGVASCTDEIDSITRQPDISLKLKAPTEVIIVEQNGEHYLYFDEVEGAYKYDISLYRSTTQASSFMKSIEVEFDLVKDGFKLEDLNYGAKFESTTYYVAVKALPNPESTTISSNRSEFVSFEVLKSVSDYTVTFDTLGGSVVPGQTIKSGSTAVRPTDPVKNGYEFVGWYLGTQLYDFSNPVTTSINLIAQWNKVGSDVDVQLIAYYDSVFENGKLPSGLLLKNSLRTLTTNTHKKKTSYADLKTYLQQADEDPNNSSNMLLFYTGESVKKSSNMNIWNREHVWAQSLGWFTTSNAGADMHHLRPCDPGVNSSRGNKKFGTASGYYTPTDEYKGDVARIIFYLMVRYPESDNYKWTSIAQSLQILLQWNELDPVSSTETIRNNYTQTIQGNRNPFIDYPEFANLIWD